MEIRLTARSGSYEARYLGRGPSFGPKQSPIQHR